jgi:hypothetical protein
LLLSCGAARAVGNHRLSAAPNPLDFGRVRAVQGIVSETVTITNESADNLGGGTYVILGAVNLPAGFSVNTRGLSTCYAAGSSLAGTTVPLRHNQSCTFTVQFDPTQLRSHEYTARLQVSYGRDNLRVHVRAQLVRTVG